MLFVKDYDYCGIAYTNAYVDGKSIGIVTKVSYSLNTYPCLKCCEVHGRKRLLTPFARSKLPTTKLRY